MVAANQPDCDSIGPRLGEALDRHPEWVEAGLKFGDASLVAAGMTNAIQAIRSGDLAQESVWAAKLQARSLSGANPWSSRRSAPGTAGKSC
jgi:hypothetical protein